jgi:hypothetical protein
VSLDRLRERIGGSSKLSVAFRSKTPHPATPSAAILAFVNTAPTAGTNGKANASASMASAAASIATVQPLQYTGLVIQNGLPVLLKQTRVFS